MRFSRIRVCMLVPDYRPGGTRAEVQIRGILERMDRRRVDPFVLASVLPGIGAVRIDGRTPVIRRPAPFGRTSFFLSSLRYLWSKRRTYDLIHAYTLETPAWIVAFVKRFLRDKAFIQHIPDVGDGSPSRRPNLSAAGRARLRYALKKADAVVISGASAGAVLKSTGIKPGPTLQIPYGVDACYYSPPSPDQKSVLKRSFGIAEDAFVAIMVGHLTKGKNVLAALKAWERVVKAQPVSSLIIVGGGPEGPRLAKYADAQFTGRKVIFTGNASREEVARLMKTADAYISYSTSGGISDAMMEAMSCGLPVVSAHGSAADRLIDHTRTGFLFDANRPMEGAEYLIRLAEDPNLVRKMSQAARRVVDERYSFESIARRLARLYLDEPDPLGESPRHREHDREVPSEPERRAEREVEEPAEPEPTTQSPVEREGDVEMSFVTGIRGNGESEASANRDAAVETRGELLRTGARETSGEAETHWETKATREVEAPINEAVAEESTQETNTSKEAETAIDKNAEADWAPEKNTLAEVETAIDEVVAEDIGHDADEPDESHTEGGREVEVSPTDDMGTEQIQYSEPVHEHGKSRRQKKLRGRKRRNRTWF